MASFLARIPSTLVLIAAVSWPLMAHADRAEEQKQDARESWRGAWVVRDADYPGSVQAWSVGANDVTIYDALHATTESEAFAVVSPCRIARTRVLPDGSEIKQYDTFAFTSDGRLHVARAPAAGGIRSKDAVTACVRQDVYIYDLGNLDCRRWNATMSSPAMMARAECRITHEGPSTYFVVDAYGGGSPLRVGVYGRSLLSDPLLSHVAEREVSFLGAVQRANQIRDQLPAAQRR
jgi:hypothetical protein